MATTGKQVDPLPDEFASEEEAGDFWDTHSVIDYEEFLEPIDLEINLEKRHFEIEVDEQSFLALRSNAQKQHKPIKEIVSEILKRELKAA